MHNLNNLLIGYGQLGVMVWMAFELRDVRRMFVQHLEMYHSVAKAS